MFKAVGLPGDATEDEIWLFCEEISGSDVEDLEYDVDTGTAVTSFYDDGGINVQIHIQHIRMAS